MSALTGYFDANGHPTLTIRVAGTHPTTCLDIDALIDTGLTGFLMLPLLSALPPGLALYGTADYTLADGSSVTNFVAEGTITVPATTPPGDSASGPDLLRDRDGVNRFRRR